MYLIRLLHAWNHPNHQPSFPQSAMMLSTHFWMIHLSLTFGILLTSLLILIICRINYHRGQRFINSSRMFLTKQRVGIEQVNIQNPS